MDKQQAEALIESELAWVKEERARYPFQEGGESFVRPRLTIIGRGDQIAVLPCYWESIEEKRTIFHRVGYLAKAVSANAVMLCSDMSFADGARVLEHYKVDVGQPGSDGYIERVKSGYSQIQSEHLQGSLSNLPRHLFSHAVGAALKGPTLGQIGRMVQYTNVNERVSFEKEPQLSGVNFELSGIRDWWTIPDDDPNVAIVTGWIDEFFKERGHDAK